MGIVLRCGRGLEFWLRHDDKYFPVRERRGVSNDPLYWGDFPPSFVPSVRSRDPRDPPSEPGGWWLRLRTCSGNIEHWRDVGISGSETAVSVLYGAGHILPSFYRPPVWKSRIFGVLAVENL